uniref:Testis expressed 15, meiosis and synapsis associated n=1 Tax=Suricata suricatta TaxID=37032 RepID=A0A673SWX4_SURSU
RFYYLIYEYRKLRNPKRTCSLNNCTVAKRIGKGKDATVIFEHFRKPVDPFVQENCSCSTLNSEINSSNTNISNSCGSMQNGNNSIHETYSGQMEYNLAECRDTSHLYGSGLSFIPSDTRESVNGDLMLNLAQLKNALSGISAAFPLHDNIGSSTVITSKLIKDPRLMRREESTGKHNATADLNEVLPLEKNSDFVNSEINLLSMPYKSASSSKVVPGDLSILTNCLNVPSFKISFDGSQSTMVDNLGSNNCNYTVPSKITMAGQCKGQDNFSFPMCLPNVLSEVENQKHSEEEAQRTEPRSNIPFLIEKSEAHNSYESVNTCTKGHSSHISPESWSSNLETVYQTGQQMSAAFPLQTKESIHEYTQNTGEMRDFTGPEDNSKHEEKQILWKEIDFTKEAKIRPVDKYISLYQEYKENESLDSYGENCDQILIAQELEIAKSSTSTTKDKYELDHLALELQRVESLSQKHPQLSLDYEDNIHTNSVIFQKLMELKLVEPNQNCVNIMTNASQEAKDIPQVEGLPIDTNISSHDIKPTHDNSDYSIAREYVCVQGKNENDPVSENIQKDYGETFQIDDEGHALFCNAEVHNDTHLNIDLREQGDNNKENENEAEEEDIALSTENSETIYGEKKSFHTNKNYTNIDKRKENKNYNNVEILSSEKFCTFNLSSEERHVSTEATLLEHEDCMTAIQQKDTPNTGRAVEHLVSTAFPKVEGSSVHVASSTAVQTAGATVPTLIISREDHLRYQNKETSSETLDFGLLVKHKVSDCEMDIDNNKLPDSFHQSVNDTSVLQSFKLENKIEVGSEQCVDGFLIQQDSQRNDPCEEFRATYEALMSRIDWEGILGSNIEEREVLESSRRKENSDQHYPKKSIFNSSIQKNKAELNPILVPDLQITVTNTFMAGFSPTFESQALKDNFCKYVTKATEPEINEEEKESEFEMYSHCSGENSDYPCEDEFGNRRQGSGLVSMSEISLSLDVSHSTQVNHVSEQQNSGPLLTEPSTVTALNNENRCSLTESKTDCNDIRSKKDTQSRISKRKRHTPFRDQNMPHKDLKHSKIYGKKKRLTSPDSSERFSSLSQGRIKTFSKSEKHIRSVLDILNSEASLCKSKRLSKRLDRAVLHLKKAHRRVHTSLQLIAKVGKRRKGPLPKSYAIICNNFWESCDLQGYSSVSERRYYSTKHFLSKRKYGKPGEKRALGFEVDKSLTYVSNPKSYIASRERIAKCISKRNMASSVSRSHTTIHVSGFCDQEYSESQLALCSTSQRTSQSIYNKSHMRNRRSSELQPFSETTGCLFSPACPDEKLTEKENQIGIEFLSNISKYGNPENHLAHNNIKDAENNSKTNKVINKTNLASLSCVKEDNISFSRDPSYDATCIMHTKVKTDIDISVLESDKKHCLNVDVCTPDNLILSGHKGNLEVNLPMEEWIAPNQNSFPTSPDLCLQLVTEERKNCRRNTMTELFSSDSYLLLKESMKGSSKQCMTKKDIWDRKMWKVKPAEKARNSLHRKSMTEGCTVKTEYKNQKNKILEEFSYLNEKTTKSNLIDSHLNIENISAAVTLNNTVSKHLNKREKEGGVKVSKDSQSNSALHSEIACNSKPGIIGMNHMPVSHMHSQTSKISTPQKEPASYMNGLKEKHCSANHSALTARIAQILRRADETSSLQILQEETKACQNILPSFVEAFERKQECSLEQILISRGLLVEQNQWNNCRHNLKPCAVDSLVELQMMMEIIQFIENKKRLLGGEPTYRSLLWYDETLYSELLGRPRGFQQQSNLYPAFQGRLKYNAFCELQTYHDQLIELFEETKRENNSYYALLKYRRQINECEAIMKRCSDCFDFSLSVPFTCGVNFGDNLGDLEILRKSTLKLIGMNGEFPKVDSYPGKQDHLWIIIDMVTSKVNFIKNSEAVSIKISLYGLERIFFDAAKSLIWKEKRQSFSNKYSGKKNKETLLKMNQYAFSELKNTYDMLSKDLSSEQISNIGLENMESASKKSDDLINKAPVTLENCGLNSTLLSHPDICCISEVLDQAEFADSKKLQELTLRCTEHLEILKKYFEILQEENIDNILITEENVLDMVENHNNGSIILKPAAIETYVEIVMLLETVHFLENSMAKKLDKQRFRGMLWFDLSLLPELVHCQEKMASFSFLKGNSTDCLWKAIETAISELKKDLDIIYKYGEAVNCSYALHLLSRELQELTEIQKLLNKSQYSVSTYIDFVPYIASINYGSTMTELEYSHNQFSTLLKNIKAAPRKDLGKMAHIMKVMKTIEHMKIICTNNAELTISFILCQMLHNRKKSSQLQGKENRHVKPRKSISKSSIDMKVPSVSECIMKTVSNSSKKRSIAVDKCEDPQEQEKNPTVASCKKQKVTCFKTRACVRNNQSVNQTTRSHPESESEIGPSSSDNLKRNHVSPKKIEMERSLPGSLLPLKNLKDTCTSKSEGKIDLTNISSATSEDFTGQQGNLNSMKKRDVNFSAAEAKSDKDDCFASCEQKSVDGIFRDIPTNLETSNTVFALQDNEILNSSIKNSARTNPSESKFIQDKFPVLQVNKTQPEKTELKEKYMEDTLSPNTNPVGASGNITLNVNQTAEHSFSDEQTNEHSKVLTQNAAACWNELPQSACAPIHNSSQRPFGTSYPYYAWCVYHYSNSSGSSITQAYQGTASYDAQPPPAMLTAIASSFQNVHSSLSYSHCFGYFSGEPQANDFVPVSGYFQSQMPISYNFQQLSFPQFAPHQAFPPAVYPYPPNSGVLPQVPWTYGEFYKF